MVCKVSWFRSLFLFSRLATLYIIIWGLKVQQDHVIFFLFVFVVLFQLILHPTTTHLTQNCRREKEGKKQFNINNNNYRDFSLSLSLSISFLFCVVSPTQHIWTIRKWSESNNSPYNTWFSSVGVYVSSVINCISHTDSIAIHISRSLRLMYTNKR